MCDEDWIGAEELMQKIAKSSCSSTPFFIIMVKEERADTIT